MKIGNFEIKTNVFLGPMAGFSDLPFRTIAKKFGAGLTYTEMVSAKALYYGDKKTQRLLVPEDDACAVQIFGAEPDIMAFAAKQLQEWGAPMIDINMGCPAPKIVNNGEGSALIKKMDLAERIVATVRDAISIPLTVKVRRGWDACPDAAIELASRLCGAGADAICVHGRTREQYYSGKADWEIIKRVKQEVSCPVIGNGDVCSHEDYNNMLEQTGCDAVMIARAASNKPWIFKECLEGKQIELSLKERLELILYNYELSVGFYGEYVAIPQMRKQFHCYIKGIPGAAKLKEEINRLDSYEQVRSLILNMLNAITEN